MHAILHIAYDYDYEQPCTYKKWFWFFVNATGTVTCDYAMKVSVDNLKTFWLEFMKNFSTAKNLRILNKKTIKNLS
jgi:hypothetical protein